MRSTGRQLRCAPLPPITISVRPHVSAMELTGFDRNCVALVDDAPNQRSRHCFRSALKHLELAEALVAVDPAMAIFRGITAEEEAASGLMFCLQELGYQNSKKLNPRNHVHKSAMIPFFRVLGSFFEETIGANGLKPALHIKIDNGTRRLTVAIPMQVNGSAINAYPIPPLNFSVKSEGRSPSYRRQIERHAQSEGFTNMTSYVKREANLRNELLYASPAGYPTVNEVNPKFLAIKQSHVLALMRAYLFVFPYPDHQLFVQDALDAFLVMLGRLDDHNLHAEV